MTVNMTTLEVGQRFVYVGPAEWAGMKPSEQKREPRYTLIRRVPCHSYDRVDVTVRNDQGSSQTWCCPNIAPVVVFPTAAEQREQVFGAAS